MKIVNLKYIIVYIALGKLYNRGRFHKIVVVDFRYNLETKKLLVHVDNKNKYFIVIILTADFVFNKIVVRCIYKENIHLEMLMQRKANCEF